MRSLLIVLASCAIDPVALPAHHPANPRAPIGHLAPAPLALAPGGGAVPAVPPTPMPPMHHP